MSFDVHVALTDSLSLSLISAPGPWGTMGGQHVAPFGTNCLGVFPFGGQSTMRASSFAIELICTSTLSLMLPGYVYRTRWRHYAGQPHTHTHAECLLIGYVNGK